MSDAAASAGIVENLVTQFSSALDCFRELVQNSIDSGSTRVEVWSEFTVGEGHVGAIAFHVDDFGEGMDEAIIDDQLTRLFASSKEDDLTKIGKFGIGFVSVFALDPKAVLVNTGRGGEYWEVLFHEDRSFSKTRLDVPVEGTQVTIFKEGDYHDYRESAAGVEATLRRWCSHSETEVTYEDRSPPGSGFSEAVSINEPFEVPGHCATRVDMPGTEIVLAYTPTPSYGFYNRGLTLALTDIGDQVFSDQRSRRFRRISVKIKSRYLEHTLSRETVMRDENYEKAMELLDQGADGPLLEQLVGLLRELVAREAWGLTEMDRYATLAGFLLCEPEANLRKLMEVPILRSVFGAPLTPKQAYDAYLEDGRVLFAEQPTDLAREVQAQGVPTILGRPWHVAMSDADDAVTDLADAHPLDAVAHVVGRFLALRRERSVKGVVWSIFGHDISSRVWQAMTTPERVYLHVALDEKVPAELEVLLNSARQLLKSVDAGYRKMRTFTAQATTSTAPFFVTGRKLSSLMCHPPEKGQSRRKKLDAAVNREHPHFEALLRLHGESPALAAYCLAKSLLLNEDRLLNQDVAMMKTALKCG